MCVRLSGVVWGHEESDLVKKNCFFELDLSAKSFVQPCIVVAGGNDTTIEGKAARERERERGRGRGNHVRRRGRKR